MHIERAAWAGRRLQCAGDQRADRAVLPGGFLSFTGYYLNSRRTLRRTQKQALMWALQVHGPKTFKMAAGT